ncbi:MAG: 4Fe-4S dicluster domain-containing protein [Candidatus Lernaella stagnicola]|nr:4Fe-4S dicluster domain-containing protein [Candidatus Lernaella stagnicola]
MSDQATPEVVNIYIMGKQYVVPDSLTIQKAFEYAGYKWIRGCGCRGGICGACATVFRYTGSYKIEVGLACQTVVQEGMYIAQIPFFPAPKATYDVDQTEATVQAIAALYPDLYKCMGCNTCTKSCPMEIPVMEYISAVIRGDLREAARLSFDCVMCGLCAARCPAELKQYHIAELARRLVGVHLMPRSKHLAEQTERIRIGTFDDSLDELVKMEDAGLRKLYVQREMQPQEENPNWKPKDDTYL